MVINRIKLAQKFALAMERARLKHGLTQAEMAKKMDMSASNYKKMISGDTTKIDFIYVIRLFELTGFEFFEILGDKAPEAEILSLYFHLSDRQKRFLTSVARFEANYSITNPNASEYLTVIVPTGNMEDGMIYDSCNLQKIEASEYYKRFGERLHMGVRVTSNHLHPVYNVDDVLLVCCEPIRDGDTGIFLRKSDGCIYIRKFHQTDPCTLEPINGYGRTFTVDQRDHDQLDQWVKIGYVLAKVRN